MTGCGPVILTWLLEPKSTQGFSRQLAGLEMTPAPFVTVPVKPPDGVIVKTNERVSPRLIVTEEVVPPEPLKKMPGGSVSWANAQAEKAKATIAAAKLHLHALTSPPGR